MTGRHGFALIDAMAAVVVAGCALALLARTGRVVGATVHATAETSALLDLSNQQLERLRRWPQANGTDNVNGVNGAHYARTWSSTGGRGLPRQLSVTATITTSHRSVTLSSRAYP